MRKYIIILLIIIAVPAGAQDLPDLSNYQHNWMIYNAAFTGSRDAMSISTFLRQKDFTGPGPMYQQVSGHTPLKNEKLALGVNWFSEQNAGTLFGDNQAAAPFKKSSILFNYAYRMWLGGGRLSLGLSGGVTSFVEDFNNLTLTDPGDASFIAGEREYLPNFGAGALYYVDNKDKKYFVGLSVPYFLSRGENRNSIVHDFNTYTGVFTGGYRFKMSDAFSIFPTALVMFDMGTRTLNYQGSLNFGFIQDKITIGTIYKSSKAFAVNANIELSKRIMLGYSYDYYLDNVNSYFSGSHEIVLRYEFRKTIESNVPFYY